MTSEQKLRDAIVAYRTALESAKEAARAAAESLKDDILVTTLQSWTALQSIAYGPQMDQTEQAVAALDARIAAMNPS